MLNRSIKMVIAVNEELRNHLSNSTVKIVIHNDRNLLHLHDIGVNRYQQFNCLLQISLNHLTENLCIK